ncbi:hypothetical protein Ciccas_010058 [Cichlidogyrus casuarinus]|uniref:Uncharacterized protein n=1 Tax=Cichlidogyrus casuarinus TaxID=1844966 RepID=A0ABD2PZR9_9PLAT
MASTRNSDQTNKDLLYQLAQEELKKRELRSTSQRMAAARISSPHHYLRRFTESYELKQFLSQMNVNTLLNDQPECHSNHVIKTQHFSESDSTRLQLHGTRSSIFNQCRQTQQIQSKSNALFTKPKEK